MLDVKPQSKKELAVGTRVCVIWSHAFNYFLAGTVDGFDSNMIQVTLDDSDKRAVSIDNVRLLPPNYPLVGKTII